MTVRRLAAGGIDGGTWTAVRQVSVNPERFWFFISHSGDRDDRREADRFVAGLRRFVLPAGLRRVSSRAGVLPARLWPVAQGDGGGETGALERSENLVVVCSRAAAASVRVGNEVAEFLRLRGGERIFCLVVDGEPNAADPSRECLPAPLRRAVSGREILAADPRHDGDGRREAMLKIVAGATGIDYGRLAGRERARAMARLGVWFFLSVLLAAGAGGLAWLAESGRVRAEGEVRRANLTSDYLTSVLAQFMPSHGDGIPVALLRPLVDAEVLDGLAGALGDAPMELFKVRNTLGDVYLGAGRTEEALVAFRKNMELGAELFGTESREYSVARFNLAKAMDFAGRYEEAIRLLDENLAYYKRQGHSPAFSSVVIALGNKSAALRALGRREEAAEINLRIYRSIAPVDDIPSIAAAPLKNNHALDLRAAGEYRRSTEIIEEVVDDLIEEHGEGHNAVAYYLAALSVSCIMLHENDPGPNTLERALEVSAKAVERTMPVYGDAHRATLFAVRSRVRALALAGRAGEAGALFLRFFGNPPDRKKLEVAGFDPDTIEGIVKEVMRGDVPGSDGQP